MADKATKIKATSTKRGERLMVDEKPSKKTRQTQRDEFFYIYSSEDFAAPRKVFKKDVSAVVWDYLLETNGDSSHKEVVDDWWNSVCDTPVDVSASCKLLTDDETEKNLGIIIFTDFS